MTIRNLKIFSRKGPIDLPDWIKFAFELGSYISVHGIKNKKSINLIISLPNELFFSLFIAMGIADKVFSKNKQMRSIRKTIINLEKGSRIIYQDEHSARKASVISVEPSPVFNNEMILIIKDGKIERGIPEKYWIDRVILLDEDSDEIKRTRKVSNKLQVGLGNNQLLRSLYSINQLNKVEFYPGDSFYLIGNLNQINETINKEIFIYKDIKGSAKDFLYIDNSNSYRNGKLFSSQMKKLDVQVNKEVPVIYSDLNSFIKQDKHFIRNPKIIISSRLDNENRLHECKEEIKRTLYQGNYNVVTEEIVNFIKLADTKIPLGVEFLAWR